jgi:hypothetical protein
MAIFKSALLGLVSQSAREFVPNLAHPTATSNFGLADDVLTYSGSFETRTVAKESTAREKAGFRRGFSAPRRAREVNRPSRKTARFLGSAPLSAVRRGVRAGSLGGGRGPVVKPSSVIGLRGSRAPSWR